MCLSVCLLLFIHIPIGVVGVICEDCSVTVPVDCTSTVFVEELDEGEFEDFNEIVVGLRT